MKAKQFDKQAKELFGGAVSQFNFTSSGSKRATFWRKVSNDIYHIIMPALGKGGIDFSVFVFPTSPVVQSLFDEKFPDDLGVITETSLSEADGVTQHGTRFFCKYPDILTKQFEKRVRLPLIKSGIPYLGKFKSIESMIPEIRNPFCLALALSHLGDRAAARQLLESESHRIALMDRTDPELARLFQLVDKLMPGQF